MHEINLVPEVKIKMIKTLKLRNLIFFICIVVMAASVGVAVVSGSVAGAQRIAMEAKNGRIESMSAKLGEFSSLGEFLTIQSQLENISETNANRKVLSRVFGLMGALVPKNGDTVEISELNVNMEEMSLTMEAQANAGKQPDIDYRVLESFKKGVSLAKYDYGRYVDEGGAEIPTYCIVEVDADGNMYQQDGAYYALWKKNQKGCSPTAEAAAKEAAVEEEEENEDIDGEEDEEEEEEEEENEDEEKTYKIWRTPRFDKWYENYQKAGEEEEESNSGNNNNNNRTDNDDDGEGEGNSEGDEGEEEEEELDGTTTISLDGTIDGGPHFESVCIKYEGTEAEDGTVRWSSTNDCMLSEEGLTVAESSNGRDSDDALVLKFTASMTVAEEVFSFGNKHMMVIGPEAQDVTDSYRQMQGIFAKQAEDCADNDPDCSNNSTNSGSSGGTGGTGN